MFAELTERILNATSIETNASKEDIWVTLSVSRPDGVGWWGFGRLGLGSSDGWIVVERSISKRRKKTPNKHY